MGDFGVATEMRTAKAREGERRLVLLPMLSACCEQGAISEPHPAAARVTGEKCLCSVKKSEPQTCLKAWLRRLQALPAGGRGTGPQALVSKALPVDHHPTLLLASAAPLVLVKGSLSASRVRTCSQI